MKKMITDYLKKVEKINSKDIENKEKFLEDMLVQINFFQQERLIHFLVTIFVGLAAILFFGLFLILENMWLFVLVAITLTLFSFYIGYYYFLENSVQRLFSIYNKLKK